jgi:predicted AAA+ superfamily ATPase
MYLCVAASWTKIDWNDRMIGIKGTRGVGKTTFLLQYAKENFGKDDRQCLYVNMNNFYFQGRGIADFAHDFVSQGGKVLLIDQVFKQPNWSKELRRCYDLFPQLKIVFTGSSVDATEIGETPSSHGICEELQPQRILVPRVSQPQNRSSLPALYAR